MDMDVMFICRRAYFINKKFFLKVEKNIKNVEYIKKVECILQNPELPTGCEAAAAAMLLNSYGYRTDKMTVAAFLEKSDQVEEYGTIYACHPNDAFIGNPYTVHGYGAFPKVVVKAMQKVIDQQNGRYKACTLYGKTEEELLEKIDTGNPLCVWTSMYNMEIEYKKGWYLIQEGLFTEEYFEWPSNEHVVVLTGYDETVVEVCDPLIGVCTYSRESFFRHYKQVGRYAVMLSI